MEKIRKVLLVVPRLNIGGAESYTVTVALGLKNRGYDVHVASGGGRLVHELACYGIRHHFVPMRINAVMAARLLERIAVRNGIELIHANSAAAGIAAVKVKKRIGIPVVYTAHGVFGHNAKEMTLNDCDRLICVSDYVREFAVGKGFTADKLVTIYTGVDGARFKPDEAVGREVRQQLHIPPEAFTLALVARIKNLRNKGHQDILDVLNTPEARSWQLIIVGKGRALWQLKYRVWRSGLAKRVHCTGHSTNVVRYLNAADALVLPSNFETFGLVLVEGMLAGKPAVTYAVGGTPEAVCDGQTGYLAKAHDKKELYAKLALLAADREQCSRMGQQARQYALQQFNCETMMQALTAVYEDTAAGLKCRN